MINIHRGTTVHVVTADAETSSVSEVAHRQAAVMRDDAAVIAQAADGTWHWVAVGGAPVQAAWLPLHGVDEDDAAQEVRRYINGDPDIYSQFHRLIAADHELEIDA